MTVDTAGRLFHVSDQPDITLFKPRPVRLGHPNAPGRPVVWAVGERLLHNYLLPRDCPRVTFYSRPDSNPTDVTRLMGQTAARFVVAIESRWLAAVREAVLYLYEFSSDGFDCLDEGAGYYASAAPAVPRGVRRADDLLKEITERDVELRITPSLWSLHDAVAASTLQFSCIRMRNAGI